MFQRSAASDLGELIQKYLGPAIIGFFVFVLPAIRAAQTAKKEREALKKRTLERGGSAPGEEQEGRQAWQDLLQGRGAPPSAPPPLPPRSRIPVSRVEPAEVDEEDSLEENVPPPLVELPSAREAGESDEPGAEALVARREREESTRQVEIAAAEYAASSPYRSEVAPQAASAVPIVSRPVAPPQGAAERWLFPQTPARDRRAAMQRAIVLREVLGPPVGLS